MICGSIYHVSVLPQSKKGRNRTFTKEMRDCASFEEEEVDTFLGNPAISDKTQSDRE
jgi:hypothetical protein